MPRTWYSIHDFKFCSCESCAVDGGHEYLRRCGKDANGKKIRKKLEVDFVVNQEGKRFYVQSALSIADPEKKNRR
ncbi:MAG: hypothetical protein MR523_00405 [Lachnospiraceae bacterium]|nr:hypothetical protein [Lachnospiraceae bacterium]